MSLILEALRKSEAERRRGDLPDLRAELPPPVAAKRMPLRRALPWILAIAIVGIAVALLWRPWSREATPPEPASVETTTPVNGVRLQPRPQPIVAVQPEPVRAEPRKPPQPQPVPEPAVATPSPPAPVAAPEPETPAATAPPQDPATDGETSINALPGDLRKALPPLQLSMHMWDPEPARRFVILDGERYGEGDSVGPLQIRRIDADGVLFDWQGRALRLPLR